MVSSWDMISSPIVPTIISLLANYHDGDNGESPHRRLKTTPLGSSKDQALGTFTRWGFGVPRGGGATSRVGVPNPCGGVQPPRRLVGSRGERSPRRITERVQRVPPTLLDTSRRVLRHVTVRKPNRERFDRISSNGECKRVCLQQQKIPSIRKPFESPP